MSVPDKDLDEPDEAICHEHLRPQPCQACKCDYLLDRAEELRERRLADAE